MHPRISPAKSKYFQERPELLDDDFFVHLQKPHSGKGEGMRGPAILALVFGGLFLMVSPGGCASRPSPAGASEDPLTEEVRFRHGNDELAGTLFLPAKPGPHPAVALVSGSDPTDRANGGVGTALGRHFARHGVACLCWDRPGVGRSTGDSYAQSLRDRAEEALAAARCLRDRDDIRRDRVGLWGHSQGGMVIPMAASFSGDVAFLIEVSGWQGPAWHQDAIRVGAELRADGFPEADVEQAVAFAKRRMDLIRGTGPFEVLDKEQVAVMNRPWFASVHRCDRVLFYSARRNVDQDTEPFWEKVHCPVLVIYGDKDVSSGPPEPLVAVIRRGLAKAGNRDVTVHIFPDADHSICRAKTGGPKEARERARSRPKGAGPEFVPGYLETMTSWLTEKCARAVTGPP
jgi:pimeloyl-ACP methyl ester carboxylesterase